MSRLNAKLIKAKDPTELIEQVNREFGFGRDLYAPLFVSADGLLCQFMIPMLSIYEYKLIVANDLADLETQTNNLLAFGYDFLYSVLIWQGKYLQWMSRDNATGYALREAVAASMVPADRIEEISLVEDVRSDLGLEPKTEYCLPFPTQHDAERLGANFLHTLGLDIPKLMVVGGVVIS